MTTPLSRLIVRAAAALVPDPQSRARYREQWSADVEGAAEVGMSALPVACGAATAALRMAATDRRSITALTRAPLLPGIGPRPRRTFGIVQLAVAAPYLWALALYGYARVRLGLSHTELVDTPYDPKDLITLWPLFWIHPVATVWLAVGGWTVSAALAPVGLVLALGGRRAARWLPLAGSVAALAVTTLAVSAFGDALRTWILD